MKRLFVYLQDYKKECILAPLFKMLEASFELCVPLLIAALIDRGIGMADKGYMIWMSGGLIGLAVVGLIASVTAQYFSAKAALGFGTALRHDLFKHLLGLSFGAIDQVGTSTMITRMTSDVNQAQNGVNMVLRLFLRSPFVVLGAAVMAFTIDIKLAFIFVVAIIALCGVVLGLMLWAIPLFKVVQQKLDGLMTVTRENLIGVRVIRAFAKEEEEVKRFGGRNEVLVQAQKKAGAISALLNPLTYVMINLAIVWLIWGGALTVKEGNLTSGQVIALYNYMSQILVELIKFASLLITINKSIACSKRIAEVLELQGAMEEGNKQLLSTQQGEDAVAHVVFDQVSLTYAGAGEASLKQISFSANRGEVIGILGGTGSGKSSLVHLIPRFYDATKGQVLIDGKNVNQYTLDHLRQKVAVVMQKAVLFEGDVKSNLAFGKAEATEQEMKAAIRSAEAEDVLYKLGDLESKIEQGGRNLSGGQRQRMSIARGLIKKSEILILDDSTSALDFGTEARLRKKLSQLEGNPTVFIVSQRASAVRYADRIVVLDDGELVGCGSHAQLLAECEVYQEIYTAQYRGEQDA